MNLTTRKTRNILIGLFTLCSLGLSLSIFAGTKKENPVEIKIDNNEKSQPIFQLKINNKEAGEYLIVIEDNSGNQIYSEKISGTNLIKKYRFKDADENLSDGNIDLVFKVTSIKTGKTQAYKISSTSQTVQTYSVAKL
jgi:hypothetical protein